MSKQMDAARAARLIKGVYDEGGVEWEPFFQERLRQKGYSMDDAFLVIDKPTHTSMRIHKGAPRYTLQGPTIDHRFGHELAIQFEIDSDGAVRAVTCFDAIADFERDQPGAPAK